MTTARISKSARPDIEPRSHGILQCASACGQHSLQRNSRSVQAESQHSSAPPIVHEVLSSPGQPLDTATRAFFEPRFGHDFSHVRLHTDALAEQSAAAIDALAYTSGRDVVFQRSHYQPDTLQGRLVLAHELAHVIQQNGSPSRSARIGAADDSSEREADVIAQSVILGKQAPGITAHTNNIQRMPYRVVSGDTLGRIAQRFGTTVAALRQLNNLRSNTVRLGQQLEVPPINGCAIHVPPDADTQVVTGAIFAEAQASRPTNDEREAIAWAFVNSVSHTLSLCDGSICPQLNERSRRSQCRRDRTDLGDTYQDAVRIGSAAFGNARWNMVMSGNTLLPVANLCLLSPPSEITALMSAVTAAETVMSSTIPPNNFVRFNRAANQPPSSRMERAEAVGAHTFYRFKPNGECG